LASDKNPLCSRCQPSAKKDTRKKYKKLTQIKFMTIIISMPCSVDPSSLS